MRGALRQVAVLLSALLSCLAAPGCARAERLTPFASDGCSSFPDGPPGDPERWRACCVAHDRAYWLGGSYAERRAADDAFATCIAAAENQALAATMWAGVRAGGSPWWPTSYRWGYGWPWPRGYRPLSPEERAQAAALAADPPDDGP